MEEIKTTYDQCLEKIVKDAEDLLRILRTAIVKHQGKANEK